MTALIITLVTIASAVAILEIVAIIWMAKNW